MTIRIRAPVALFLLLLAACAAAQVPDTVFLEQLTTVELQQKIRAGSTTIIVPIGGTEQSGPHMTLGKHNVRVKFLAERIARALGNAIVAPVVAYVPEGETDPLTSHMRFPGTITVPTDVFEKTLAAAARGFKAHGFRDVVFLGDHGGYKASLAQVAKILNQQWAATPARAHAIPEYYRVTQQFYVPELKKRGYTDNEIGTHAGLADTSLMLAVDPNAVRVERLHAVPHPGVADGVYGDPARSSAELGQIAVNAIVAQTVAAINAATARR
jgi:creatinine amidohydrolase/Fe(II)-dependent formamide hydrolase-like protein